MVKNNKEGVCEMSDTKENIQKLMRESRTALAIIEDYNQVQVDAIVKAIGKVVYDHAEELAKESMDETKIGVLDSKICLNTVYPMTIWNYLKDKTSIGIIDDDPVNCVKTYAKPVGVVACVTPRTTPSTTPTATAMNAIKGRNSVIVSAHPSAIKVTTHTVNLMRNEIEKLGAPANLIQIVENTTLEATQFLMSSADVVVATGGYAMVKAAYASGRPSLGVGQGNAQALVDRSYTDYQKMVTNIVNNRTTDNGTACVGEQTLIAPEDKVDEILTAFRAQGAFIIDDEETVAKIRDRIFINGIINQEVIGQRPPVVAKKFGITIPDDTRLLMLRCSKYGADDILCKEIMCPIVRVFTYHDFKDAVEIARANLFVEGAGHSSCIMDFHADKQPLKIAKGLHT
jgi:succinate-semialdehyde dehydrogenase